MGVDNFTTTATDTGTEETTTAVSLNVPVLETEIIAETTAEETTAELSYTELLVYQNERLTEISSLLTYSLILSVVVIAVLVCKWISSVINAI